MNWNDPALTGIDRIQYYATSGLVVSVAERPMRVVFTMDRDEAQAVFDVLTSVGGNPTKSRRRHIDRVVRMFLNLGYKTAHTDDVMGGLYLA